MSGGSVQAPRSAAAHTFHDFQASVSDAWDIEEPLTPGPGGGGQAGGPQGPLQQQSAQSITPVHTQVGAVSDDTLVSNDDEYDIFTRDDDEFKI